LKSSVISHQSSVISYQQPITHHNLSLMKYWMQPKSRFVALLTITAIAAGCSSTATETVTPTDAVAPQPSPSAVAPSPQATTQASEAILSDAEDMALGAIAVTQSAVSPEDWQLVASRWERAIALLQTIPESDANGAIAQEKIGQYQQNLTLAKQRQSAPVVPTKPNPPSLQATSSAQPKSEQPNPENAPPAVNNQPPKVALAQHLNRIGAKLYSTYWCGACKYQRNLFGQEAFTSIQEIECDPRGKNARPDLCNQAGVRAYPTWVINGQTYRGARPLSELAALSGYNGDLNF
jgi:hypothetical protein